MGPWRSLFPQRSVGAERELAGETPQAPHMIVPWNSRPGELFTLGHIDLSGRNSRHCSPLVAVFPVCFWCGSLALSSPFLVLCSEERGTEMGRLVISRTTWASPSLAAQTQARSP